MNRKRLLFITVALSLVLVSLAAFLFFDVSSKESTKTLPDGSVLTLRGITKGTKHRYISGDLYQRMAGRVLPEKWSKKLGAQSVTYNSINVTHIVWLERTAPTNAIRGLAFPSNHGPRVTNDAGFDRSYQSVAQLYTPGRYIEGFLLDACPTDSRKIGVVIRQMPFARMPSVSFNASNPDFVRRRKWQSRPCPIEVVQGDISVRLERFATQVHNSITARGVPWTELTFAIQDRTTPTNNWFARSVRIFNQAGSELLPAVYPTEVGESRTYVTFPGGLSSAEPYKLSFELRRASRGPEVGLESRTRTIEVIAQPTLGPWSKEREAGWKGASQ